MNLAFPDPTTRPHIIWEECACPLCDSNEWDIVLEAPDPLPRDQGMLFAVVRCQSCALCFTNPRPDAESIASFYPDSYRPHRSSESSSRSRLKKRYPELPRWLVRKHGLADLHGRGRLLDFGCGGGMFLQQMQQLGWQVTGVDTSTATVDRLQGELGLQAYAGSLPHPKLPPRSFDVVTMWHSLEHVHAPREVLTAAWRLLVPGGKLIVAVPNMDSLPFRWFGTAWYGLDLPRHLTHFSADTLLKMLWRCGFEIDSLGYVRHSSWLRYSARLARRKRLGSVLMNRLMQFKTVSRLVSWYSFWTRQTDALLVVARRPGM